MITWYAINLTTVMGGLLFSGYFSVDTNTNILTSFYDSNDLQTNILWPSGTPYSGIFAGYDNKYESGWQQFDANGILLNNYLLTNYGIHDIKYENVRVPWSLHSGNINDELMTNDGRLQLDFPEQFLLDNPSYIGVMQPVFFDIQPIDSSPIPESTPISNICFIAGTRVKTDQRKIAIDHINPRINTIGRKRIVSITKTITQDTYLVCIERGAFGDIFPSEKTIMTKNHKIVYRGQMIEVDYFVGKNPKISRIQCNNEILYNVLMDEYSIMIVNNLTCETLDPANYIAKLYTSNIDKDEKDRIILFMNDSIIKNNEFAFKKIMKRFIK